MVFLYVFSSLLGQILSDLVVDRDLRFIMCLCYLAVDGEWSRCLD